MMMMLAILLQNEIVRDLQSDDYAVREAATQRLLERGPGPDLDRALAHADPEVRARAEWVRRTLMPEPEPVQQSWEGPGIIISGLSAPVFSGGVIELSVPTIVEIDGTWPTIRVILPRHE